MLSAPGIRGSTTRRAHADVRSAPPSGWFGPDIVGLASDLSENVRTVPAVSAARRRPQAAPPHPDEFALGHRLATVSELNSEELALVTSFIDALVAKTRLKVLASES
jgi:hypothetical protein